jgi:hypothetical protein
VAVHLRKPGEPEPDKERVVVRPQSKPGASVEDVRTRTVTISDIDRAASTVTVKDASGNLRSYRVRDPQRLEGVKVGDNVDIYFTTALLLKVDCNRNRQGFNEMSKPCHHKRQTKDGFVISLSFFCLSCGEKLLW